VHTPAGDAVPARVPLTGDYNVANALCAVAALGEAGFDPRVVADGLAATAGVPGRLERVDAGQDFLAVVDYAHKPDAVQAALAALRPQVAPGGRLTVVLGAGGDRDPGKRPIMGETAARLADVLVVTDDNPRSEDAATIRAAVLAGAAQVPAADRAEVVEEGDRRLAIRHAVAHATAGDVVVVAGKGHETGQEVHGIVHPFDDRDVLREELAALRGERAR
jgi:UDP-N-acetylmuramoyl-L-alanyl-D-glutamate--2,6-diaminopimelate ligase